MDAMEQARSTGGGLHGRLLLIADHETLPAAVLDKAVRDLLANLISVAEANARTIDTFRAAAGSMTDPELRGLISRAISMGEQFGRLHEEVARMSAGDAAPDEGLSRIIAARAREWAWSGILARDAARLVGSRMLELQALHEQAA